MGIVKFPSHFHVASRTTRSLSPDCIRNYVAGGNLYVRAFIVFSIDNVFISHLAVFRALNRSLWLNRFVGDQWKDRSTPKTSSEGRSSSGGMLSFMFFMARYRNCISASIRFSVEVILKIGQREQ